jgi:3-dehydroquinate synthase class II
LVRVAVVAVVMVEAKPLVLILAEVEEAQVEILTRLVFL